MTENELRKKLVAAAVSYFGCKESDGSHKKIIDLYNSHRPLARNYPMKYTDAWCSTYASAVAIACGLTDIIPTECGCEEHIKRFQKLGRWVENDAHVPAPGDYIFYDWEDSGAGDCTGYANHVGIVTAVSGQTVTVLEGNKNNAVGYRTLAVNGRYIRGYGVPDYAGKAASGSAAGDVNTGTPQAPAAPGNVLMASVGDTVTFTGTKHYASSNAVNGKSCKPGAAKVTAVAKSGKHPYHLIKTTGGTSTVHGWVDAADIAKSGAGTIAKGSRVQVNKGAKTYTGGPLASFVYANTYTVMQVDGSRVVIGQNGVITAAINRKDLALVGQ